MKLSKNVPLNWTSSMKFFFWKLQFLKHLKHFLLKLCPFFVSWFWSFGKKYENDLRVIFDQWPKLSLGLDVRHEIPILKVIYCTRPHTILWMTRNTGLYCQSLYWNHQTLWNHSKYFFLRSVSCFFLHVSMQYRAIRLDPT